VTLKAINIAFETLLYMKTYEHPRTLGLMTSQLANSEVTPDSLDNRHLYEERWACPRVDRNPSPKEPIVTWGGFQITDLPIAKRQHRAVQSIKPSLGGLFVDRRGRTLCG
jgi:hypothetical protein